MTAEEVVRRIGYFRNREKISARELSLRIDRHESYIAKLEGKDFNLPLNVFLDIVSELGVSLEEFFADNFASWKKDGEFYRAFANLTPECKEALMVVMSRMK